MYETYADDIYRYLYVRVRDAHIAEDLTAETFMKAWRSIASFDFSQPRPWLYKIAHNLLTDHWRKQKPVNDELPEDIESDENIPMNMEKQLSKEKVRAAIAKLPEPMQSVVTMRFILGYSAKRTAETLSTNENNVRVIQYRALKKMKGYLA